MKKRVGLILRPDINGTNKDIFEIYDNFRRIIIDNNCIPIGIIPNILDINNKLKEEEINELINEIKRCDGIICQGGDDFYDYDKVIVKYAIENDIPILGICLGMQLMSSVYEDNITLLDNTYHNHKDCNHDIVISKNSKLYDIIKKEKLNVNSFHKEHVLNSGIYEINAYSDDGVIEGIEYNNNNFNIGVQWHPERDMEKDYNKKLFEAYFEAIQKRNID
ncbi:MAG: hypothetical protein E7166_05900 [Firmicutes bacterium]|nr:hypothetical protein [Bacillota bacterium]